MLSAKIIFIILGVLFALFSVKSMTESYKTEGFWNTGGFTTSMMPAVVNKNGSLSAIGGNYINPNMGNSQFVSVPSFQGILAPRFSNLSYGANIKYNMPDKQNQAVPCNPLTFGGDNENFTNQRRSQVNMLREGYAGQPRQSQPRQARQGQPREAQRHPPRENYDSGVVSCGKGAYGLGHKMADDYSLPPDVHTGNWDQVRGEIGGPEITSTIPLGEMTTAGIDGDQEQHVVVNNLMISNNKSGSRLYAQGDKIRGDIAITPCQTGWFSVYPTIGRDVCEGAMRVLNGDGESNNQTIALLASASGQTALSGVNLQDLPTYNPNMAMQTMAQLSSAVTDLNITSFP
jgi:hypothetical protein